MIDNALEVFGAGVFFALFMTLFLQMVYGVMRTIRQGIGLGREL